MKKLLVCFIACALALGALVSCSGGGEANGKTARECSDAIVSLMGEMVSSEKYESIYGISFSYKNEINRIKSGDYKKISAVYEVSLSNDSLSLGIVGFDGMSENLEAYVRSNMLSNVVSIINQKESASAVAVSSVYTASESFVCKELEADTLYLYVFDGGCPVLVNFDVGDGGAVKLTGRFIINSDFNVENSGEIKSSLESFGFKNVEVNKK